MPTLRLPHPDLSSASRMALARVAVPDALRASVLFLVVLALVSSMLVAVPQVAVADEQVAPVGHTDAENGDEGSGGEWYEDELASPESSEDVSTGEEGFVVDPGEETSVDDLLTPVLQEGPSVGGATARSPQVPGWPAGSPWDGHTTYGALRVAVPDEDSQRPWHALTTRSGGVAVPVPNPLIVSRSPSTANARTTNVFFARHAPQWSSPPTNISQLQPISSLPSVSGTSASLALPSTITRADACRAGTSSHQGCEIFLIMVPSHATSGAISAADRSQLRYHSITFLAGHDPSFPPPTVTTHPSDATVTEGQTAQFSAAASNATSRQWQMSTDDGATWQNVAGATGTTHNEGGTTLAMNNRLYRVVFTNANGSTSSNSARLRVLPAVPPPTVVTHPSGVTVFEGETAQFSASASDATSQQWQMSTDDGAVWQDVAGATSTSLTVEPTTVAMTDRLYRAVFTNASGSVESGSARLTVLPHPTPVVLEHPEDVGVGAPRGALFSASAESSTEMTVQWQVAADPAAAEREEWVDLDGATSESYELAATTLEMSGSLYRAVFTNAAGSVATDAATLTVWVAPGARLSVAPRAVHVESLRAPA